MLTRPEKRALAAALTAWRWDAVFYAHRGMRSFLCDLCCRGATVIVLPGEEVTMAGKGRTIEFLCLANSRSTGGRCVAGRRMRGNEVHEWIRLVPPGADRGLNASEYTLTKGREIRALDVVRVSVGAACPDGCHSEDVAVAPGTPELLQELEANQIEGLVEHPDDLFGGGAGSSKVGVAEASRLTRSLYLIDPESASFHWDWNKNTRKPVLRTVFSWRGARYWLPCTDTAAEARFRGHKFGEVSFPGDHLFCVSLGQPFEGYRYKLVAGVMTR